MARLSTSGSDDGSWGAILNDFLGVIHNNDGTTTDSIVLGAADPVPTNFPAGTIIVRTS